MRIEVIDAMGKSHFYSAQAYFVQEDHANGVNILRIYEVGAIPVYSRCSFTFFDPIGYGGAKDA